MLIDDPKHEQDFNFWNRAKGREQSVKHTETKELLSEFLGIWNSLVPEEHRMFYKRQATLPDIFTERYMQRCLAHMYRELYERSDLKETQFQVVMTIYSKFFELYKGVKYEHEQEG